MRATVRLEAARPAARGWSVRGELAGCGRPCDGARVRWIWRDPRPPAPGERWRLAARLAPDPVRAAPGARYPPPGLGPGGRRGALLDVRLGEPVGEPIPILAAAERHLRGRIGARFPAAVAPLAVALLLGDRDALDPALVDAFAATGTTHLLSVSGLHVGFLAGLLAFGLRLGGASPGRRTAAAALLLAGYAGLVGPVPGVLRSSAMAVLFLAAAAAERRVSPWQPWGAALVLMVLWCPLEPFDLGFALSFGAVAGLLALAGPLGDLLRGERDGRPRRALRWAATGLIATTAATIGTLPLQAAAFGWIAPRGFLVNPLAVPLSGAALPLAWLALLADAVGLAPLAGPLARAASTLLALLAALLARTAEDAAAWAPGPAAWGIGATALLAAAAALARPRPAAAGLLAASGAALLLAARPGGPAAWEVVWLDVGQGDAIVLHFPDRATWLLDAGPADPYGDAGRRVVLPYLRRRAVARLAWLVTTHPDLDHVGGAASVVRGMPVGRWGSGAPVDDAPAWLALLAARGPRGAPEAVRLEAGDRLRQGGVAIDVLHPGPGWVTRDPTALPRPANEASVVLLMGFGPCRLLLTGDLGAPGEAALVAALGDSLRAGLLHAGHHGSRHSSTAAFLARVRPAAAVVSAGRGNRYGHPHPDALGRLAAAGARVWRTDRQGPIAARCGPAGWQVAPAAAYLPAGSRVSPSPRGTSPPPSW